MKWLCAGVLLILLSGAAWTADGGFYTAQVPVASQSLEERAKATSIGLKEVLWRATGTPPPPSLSSALSRGETYLESFQYGRLNNAAEGATQQVVLQFSPQAINQLIQDYRLPLWPLNRPKILVWLVRNVDGQTPQFSHDVNEPTVVALQEAARLRGVALVFPTLDSQDLGNLSPTQVLNNDTEALLNASFRYNLDTLLVGRISATGVSWQGDHRGDKMATSGSDAALGVHLMADYLAKRYAVTSVQAGASAGGNKAVIAVEAKDFATFRDLTQYLKKQSQLSAVKLLEIHPERIVLELVLRGNLTQFDLGLSLDQVLEPAAPNTGDMGSLATPLPYRWIAK